MKLAAVAVIWVWIAGCSMPQGRLFWRVRELALAPSPAIELQNPEGKIVLTMNAHTVNKLLLAHFRITRSAGVQAELVIAEGEHPNAFVGLMTGRRVVAINTAMIILIGDDIDEFAALIGHEAAHWAKGHVDAGKLRSKTIESMGALLGSGLGMAGIPAAGLITGLGADMIDATFSRDDEREADAFGVEYMLANGFDPEAAVRLHERMLKQPGGLHVPFLSSHPSSAEKIDNLKKLIEVRRTQVNAE
ncbi:MAG: M48 family metalloprotease [Deltaproteobacteria bacterium]|nr:M48 family metalloprotease [Deltaproteobacteria bacterium]